MRPATRAWGEAGDEAGVRVSALDARAAGPTAIPFLKRVEQLVRVAALLALVIGLSPARRISASSDLLSFGIGDCRDDAARGAPAAHSASDPASTSIRATHLGTVDRIERSPGSASVSGRDGQGAEPLPTARTARSRQDAARALESSSTRCATRLRAQDLERLAAVAALREARLGEAAAPSTGPPSVS